MGQKKDKNLKLRQRNLPGFYPSVSHPMLGAGLLLDQPDRVTISGTLENLCVSIYNTKNRGVQGLSKKH